MRKITLNTIIRRCAIIPPFTRLELYNKKYGKMGKIKYHIPNVENNLKVGQKIEFKEYCLKDESKYGFYDLHIISSINHEDYSKAIIYNGGFLKRILGKLIGRGKKVVELDSIELLDKRNSLNVGQINDSHLLKRE